MDNIKFNYDNMARMLWGAFFGILIVGIIIMLCSCTKTEYVTVENVKHDTAYVSKIQRDSIWLHDSTIIEKGGDTMKIEKWHTKYVLKQVYDTLYVSKTDSIHVPYYVKQYIEKKLSTTQVVLMTIGCLAIMALFVFVAVKLKRYLPCR